jgi:hypothetical protein
VQRWRVEDRDLFGAARDSPGPCCVLRAKTIDDETH